MTAKKLAYFKFFFHDWQNSLAVRAMNANERGVYISAMIVQAQFGAVPSDLEFMARLMDLDQKAVKRAWPKVSKQFSPVEVDGKPGLLNERLSQEIALIYSEKAGKSVGGKNSAKGRSKLQDTSQVSSQVSLKKPAKILALRAYDSDSDYDSNDKSLSTTEGKSSEKDLEASLLGTEYAALVADVAGTKATAKQATKFAAVMRDVVADYGATAEQVRHVIRWFRDSAEGRKEFTALSGYTNQPTPKFKHYFYRSFQSLLVKAGQSQQVLPLHGFTPEQLQDKDFNPGAGWEQKFVTSTRRLPNGEVEEKQVFDGWVRS